MSPTEDHVPHWQNIALSAVGIGPEPEPEAEPKTMVGKATGAVAGVGGMAMAAGSAAAAYAGDKAMEAGSAAASYAGEKGSAAAHYTGDKAKVAAKSAGGAMASASKSVMAGMARGAGQVGIRTRWQAGLCPPPPISTLCPRAGGPIDLGSDRRQAVGRVEFG